MTTGIAGERAVTGIVGRTTEFAHLPALDGLRGVAILLVVLCHISEQFRQSNIVARGLKAIAFAGWTGVDLFFVLSGFLITGILCEAKGGVGYFRNFYARRTARIFPLYYVTLILLFVVVPMVSSPGVASDKMFRDLIQSRGQWLWYATYMVDALVAWKGFLFAGHFWSLAVEEHFYLAWPILVSRLSRQKLILLSLALIVSALILRAVLVFSDAPGTAIYVLTPCRMDGLALGAAMALVLRAPNGLQTMVRIAKLALPLSVTIWSTLMLLQGGWYQYGILAQTAGYLVTEIFYASLLVFTLASRRLGEVMSLKPLRLMGRISYAVYVFHVFVVFLCARWFALGDVSRPSVVYSLIRLLTGTMTAPGALMLLLDGAAYVAVALGLSVGIATLSWYLLERPCLSLKRFFPYARSAARTE
jgi:peptidoglycan/LPS O-acetylase OafA/YrhL